MPISAVPPSTQNQQALQLAASQISSGKRITSAVVDPSALAIDETSVTSGAIATISDAAQQLYAQSVTANNGLFSASDRADLQTEANATTQKINITANSAQFTGLPLANGSTPTSAATSEASANAAISTIGSSEATVGSQTAAIQFDEQSSEGASNNLTAAALNTADSDAISTITSLMQERTKTQAQVAVQHEANHAFSAVLGIIPS